MTSEETSNFCNPGNVQRCLERISSELSYYDISLVPSVNDQTVINLANSTWELVNVCAKKIDTINEQNERIINLTSQINMQKQYIASLEKSIKNSKAEIEKKTEHIMRLARENNGLSLECRKYKSDADKLNSVNVSMRMQYENDLRKSDLKLQDVQSKLYKLVKEDCSHHHPPVPDESPPKNLQSTLIDNYIGQLDSNVQILLEESASVRNTALKLYKYLYQLRKRMLKLDEDLEAFDLPEHLFMLPFEELQEKIERTAEKIVTDLLTFVESSESS